MGLPMDYGSYARTYARSRWAVPWVVAPLLDEARRTRAGARIIEIGCGTGNYLRAVGATLPARAYVGVDLSPEMLAEALVTGRGGAYAVADADRGLPLARASCAMAFVVDVLHHLTDYPTFFAEVARILERGGTFLAVTDSEENMRRRSLTRFFPEILDVELQRYPSLDELHGHAAAAGLRHVATALAEGHIDLDEDFLAKLAAKCSSGMRLIPDDAHRRGMERVRAASARGERWLSSYSVATYTAS